MKVFLLLLAFFAVHAAAGFCQEQQATVASADGTSEESSSATAPESISENTQEAGQAAPNSTLENTIDAEQSSEPPRRKLTHWNEYQGPYFTGRWGAGLLLEVAGYAQDHNSKK